MKLPNAEDLIVEREKIVDYLLNAAHRYGASKARFFGEFGFRVERWEVLAEALLEHGRRHEVARTRETGFGPRYTVEGELNTPGGRRPQVHGLATGPRDGCTALDQRVSSGAKIMIKEHECVVLTKNLPEEGLMAGDVGTVVHIHKAGEGYEVEFMTLTGETVAIVTLLADQVRPLSRRDLAHTRELAIA